MQPAAPCCAPAPPPPFLARLSACSSASACWMRDSVSSSRGRLPRSGMGKLLMAAGCCCCGARGSSCWTAASGAWSGVLYCLGLIRVSVSHIDLALSSWVVLRVRCRKWLLHTLPGPHIQSASRSSAHHQSRSASVVIEPATQQQRACRRGSSVVSIIRKASPCRRGSGRKRTWTARCRSLRRRCQQTLTPRSRPCRCAARQAAAATAAAALPPDGTLMLCAAVLPVCACRTWRRWWTRPMRCAQSRRPRSRAHHAGSCAHPC